MFYDLRMTRIRNNNAKNAPKESLGQRIRRIRNEHGLTQTELAEKIGSIQAVVSSYECDRTEPSTEVLVRIAQVLQITTDRLLGLTKTPKAKTIDRRIQRRMEKVEKLPKRDQDALLRTIDAFVNTAG